MRGTPGQQPVIIDVTRSNDINSESDLSDSADDSIGPETPQASDSSNGERRYVWKPEPDVSIPRAYDMTRGSKPAQQKSTVNLQNNERGRNMMPRLDTNLARSKSTGGPPPQLERARSPYASGPQDKKSKPDRFSGEYLLSPEMMTPRRQYAQSPRSHSQYITRPGDVHGNSRSDHHMETPTQPVRPSLESQRARSHHASRPVEVHNSGMDPQRLQSPQVSTRPSLDRRASEMPYSTTSSVKRDPQDRDKSRQVGRPSLDRRVSDIHYPPTPPSTTEQKHRSRRSYGLSEDSDTDHARNRRSSGQTTPQTPPTHSFTKSQHGQHPHHERRFSSELPLSSPRRSIPSSDTGGAPVNLSSLVSGAAITQTLNAIINGDRAASRRASPRSSPLPSPRESPKTSPFSSPPRTPPSELSQHRANPIVGLKKDLPGSRPSSPLSSRSSIWTADSNQMPHGRDRDHAGKARPPPLKSHVTAPLPSPRVEEPENPAPTLTPGIVVRSPSPAQPKKPLPAESGEQPHHPQGTPEAWTQPARPGGFAGRPRAASSVDVRPQLSVNTPHALQSSDSSISPRSRSRGNSPSLTSPSAGYKPSHLEPTSPAVRSASSHPQSASSSHRSRSRSRSYTAEPSSTTPWTQSSNLGPTPPAPRSSMPGPAPMPLPSLPICPRKQATASYNDWYTLKQNTAFVICPSCRDNVFGHTFNHHLCPLPTTAAKKTPVCDLNNPWVRLACLLRGPDVSILSALSDITVKERSCPGDRLALRDWYRLEDPDNGKYVSGFNACPHCVRSLETLFPAWKDVFYRSRSSSHHDLRERFCGLRTSGIRFGDYLDMVVESSREAESKGRLPNTKPVCDLAKQMTAIDDCPKDKMLPKKAWHIHPHLPEFAICQECYEDVVYPLAKSGLSIASKIDRKPQQFSDPTLEICCHLYSLRMRRVFREACEDDDYEHLRHTVLKRHMLQRDLLATFKEHRKDPEDREVDDRLRDLLDRWKDKE